MKKREKVIKIRVTEEEYVALKARSTKARLAEWIREVCLGAAGEKKKRPARAVSVDPALLRQLSGIGNNLNQIARRVNRGEWSGADRTQIMSALVSIERELKKLRDAYDRKDS